MANEEHRKILEQGVEVWNEWRKEHPDIWPDLREAVLIKKDLSGADLNFADLSGANLSGANLNFADLSDATFIAADLSEATLIEANLHGVNLYEANLLGANVQGAIASWSMFSNVDLSTVKGLETVRHDDPSTIGIDTLYLSKGKIPEVFLRGCGIPDRMIVFITSLPGQPETYRARLRLNLSKYFNESELRNLCFDMNIDYEGLDGNNKSDKARELITYCERHNQCDELITRCRTLYPHVSWEREYE